MPFGPPYRRQGVRPYYPPDPTPVPEDDPPPKPKREPAWRRLLFALGLIAGVGATAGAVYALAGQLVGYSAAPVTIITSCVTVVVYVWQACGMLDPTWYQDGRYADWSWRARLFVVAWTPAWVVFRYLLMPLWRAIMWIKNGDEEGS